MTKRTIVAVALVATLGASSSHRGLAAAAGEPQAPAAVTDISPEALGQIEALLREKASRTPAQRKMDSRLVFAVKMARGEAIAAGVPELQNDRRR